MKRDNHVIIHVCRGDKIPRDGHGNDKRGYVPCKCNLHNPKGGEGEAHKPVIGRSGNRKTGFTTQVNYNVPIGAPAHVSRN
ncbi:MAG: hypothetical protein MN733_24540, partial [Nitrososphaera sp.]|nr:hypothetical protein [Nitrososphaera sp.]